MSVVHVQPEGVETWRQKFMRRFKEEPLVPIGTALTCFALIMASRKVGKKGEAQSLNRWFRARIVFQGATIGAIVAGSLMMDRKKDGVPQESLSAEESKAKERTEFEARLRKAEQSHAEEQAMRGGKPKEKEKSIFAKLGLGRGPAGSVTSEPDSPPPPTVLPPVASSAARSSPANPSVPTVVSEGSQPASKSWWSWGGKSSS
ncbi:hypothetical protein BDW22DRAFT_1357917 [Trametopsis cervina]|nr:hypothetical protein BDW22DRAFT_1357917 [Trametopsis cervina]